MIDKISHKKITEKIHGIANVLSKYKYHSLPGLLIGNSGIVCFLAYYYKYYKNEKINIVIEEKLDHIVNVFNEFNLPSHYSSGYSGVAWTVFHLEKEGILAIDSEKTFDAFIPIAKSNLITHLENGIIDPFYGALGDFQLLKETGNIDDETLSIMEAYFYQNHDKGIEEFSFVDKHNINLGLAHGIAGLGLFFLNHADKIRFDISKHIYEFYLKTLNDRVDGPDYSLYLSIFPNTVAANNHSNPNKEESRFAWCYGDLGIFYYLINHYKKFKLNDHKKIVSVLAEKCNKRNLENSVIQFHSHLSCYDIGFCHGLAGIYYLHHQINRVAGFELLANKEYWLNLLLDNIDIFLKNEDFSVEMDGDKKHYDSLGILEGIAGAGLVLLSCVTGNDNWSRSLMFYN
ncbi:MAG: hypothetical protein JST52_00900 [Bacteroidetes bacterium]|nr:hypothetical protein [Bacteroidota bacterium]MBS1739186.1 hypothetical protein [Bacteroidota bacterium]